LAGAAVTRGFTRATVVGQSGQLSLVGGGIVAAIPTAWIVVALIVLIVVAIVVMIATIAFVVMLIAGALDSV
jgi:hypothetical protein